MTVFGLVLTHFGPGIAIGIHRHVHLPCYRFLVHRVFGYHVRIEGWTLMCNRHRWRSFTLFTALVLIATATVIGRRVQAIENASIRCILRRLTTTEETQRGTE